MGLIKNVWKLFLFGVFISVITNILTLCAPTKKENVRQAPASQPNQSSPVPNVDTYAKRVNDFRKKNVSKDFYYDIVYGDGKDPLCGNSNFPPGTVCNLNGERLCVYQNENREGSGSQRGVAPNANIVVECPKNVNTGGKINFADLPQKQQYLIKISDRAAPDYEAKGVPQDQFLP